MCGIDIDALLAGAADMDKRLKDPDVLKNPAALIAAIHHLLNQRPRHAKRISVMMPYASSLYLLGDWYRQLWAESIGKRVDLAGKEVFAGQTPSRPWERPTSIRRYSCTARARTTRSLPSWRSNVSDRS